MADPVPARVVIGIGNRFRRDDALGPRVIDALNGSLPSDVVTVESDGDPVGLMAAWKGADLAIVVDAVVSGGKPGTIYRFNGHHRLPAKFFRRSSHLLGLADALELARTLDRLPPNLVIVGVEAEVVDHGEELSPPVQGAMARVLDLVLRLLETETKDAAEEGGQLGVGNA